MIGLIDPAFFLPRPSSQVERELNGVIQICRMHRILVEPMEEYWPRLWRSLARDLEPKLSRTGKEALRQLRQLGAKHQLYLSPMTETQGRAWRSGFRQLFAASVMGESWEEEMAAAAIRILCSGHNLVLITRRIVDRNYIAHAAGHSIIEENTRWALHVQPRNIGYRQVLCIYNARNLEVTWTTRFDWRLPSEGNGRPYPFCPPENWWKRSIPAVRTTQSKPAWRDKFENGWARPSMPLGAGHHWDVFLGSRCAATVGLDQINVVEFGSSEGIPGHLHHLPDDKAGRVTGVGWNCKTQV